jgi:hypothetical protein
MRFALCLALCAILVCCTPASALTSRGHVFGFTFEGEGEHQFTNPSGIAVDEATQEIYVVDPLQERVERFKPNGSGGYEFASEFKVRSPGAIAIDNSPGSESEGDVYVVGAKEKDAEPDERDFISKFTPSGELIYKKSLFKNKEDKEECDEELEAVSGVAVDSSGRLWVDWGEGGNIDGFSDAEANRCIPSLQAEEALDRVEEVGGEPCLSRAGFAIAPDDEDFYLGHEKANGLGECSEESTTPTAVAKLAGSQASGVGKAVVTSLDREDTTGLATDDATGEVYADDATSVAAFAPDGSFIQRFGEGELSGAGSLAVDHASEQVLVAEEHQIAVFVGEEAGAPVIDSVYAQDVEPSKTDLFAEIDPHGEETEYEFQYGTVSCLGEPSPCTGSSRGRIPAGFGDAQVKAELTGLLANTTYYYRVLAHNNKGSAESAQSADTFFTTLPSAEGLLADHREWELVSPAEMHGAAAEPISREGALIEASADGDGIAWTASAPVSGEAQGNRRPEPVQVISSRGSEEWSSKDIATPHNRGEGIEPGEAAEYRFFSSDLSLALVQPQVPSEPLEDPPLSPESREKTIYRRNDASGEYEPLVTAADDTAGTAFGGKLEFEGASPDLSHVVFGSEVPLLALAGEAGLYEWESGAALKLISVLPGSERTPASEPELGYQGRDLRGAISADGSRVFFASEGEDGPLYMRDTVKEETIQVNAAQGEGVAEPDEEERGEGLDEVRFQAASSEGSRVFFTDSWPLMSESSLQPRSSEEVLEEPPAGSRTVPRPVDLYEYDTETGKLSDLTVDRHIGEDAGVLGTIPGTSEDGSYVYFVANGVLAPGAEPGDCPPTKPLLPQPEAQCNLYVSEPDPEHPEQRQTRLVARLSDEDAADWAQGNSPLPGDLGGLSSQVSANGRYLAFMSQRELTGYDNVDSDPEAQGAHDEEVYLYDAEDGRLICASCDPSGEPPQGVFDTHQAGEGLGLSVDRPETWSGHWLAGSVPGWTLFELENPRSEHQSRYLSDSGRLFFDSADALVAQVSAPSRQETVDGKALDVGVENVYEYEPAGLGSCSTEPGCVTLVSSGTSEHESAFLDASEGGDDVFFLTAAQLLAEDTENSLAVYDARVCGTSESEPCLPVKVPPAPACTGEACRPPAPEEPGFAAAASSTYSGPGNQATQQVASSITTKPKALTRAQKLARALKACRKLKRKKRRLACERSARKAFGAKAKPTKGKPAKKAGQKAAFSPRKGR